MTPIQYLGLPLTIKKPSKIAFLPLITNIQNRFEGYKGRNLSMAGRAILTNSTFNAAPLHYIQAFFLPKWFVHRITKITRRFLWRGTKDTYSGGHCLISWPQVTKPKHCGGLDIIDLQLQNECLLLKWVWLRDHDQDCPWSRTVATLGIAIDNATTNPSSSGSYFIQHLATLLPLHRAASRQQPNGTIATVWCASFSVKAIYTICNNPGVTKLQFVEMWNLRVPNKIKCFLWLLLHSRLHTTDNLQKKGWLTIDHCVLCTAQQIETMQHLFQGCSLTSDIMSRIVGQAPIGSTSLLDAWQQAQNSNRPRAWASAAWEIWKERNAWIFQQEASTTHILLSRIGNNIRQWSQAYD
jgi:zinc-binding in reverse transcriptase